MSEPRTFVCAVCGVPFLTNTTEAEANRELLTSGIRTDQAELLSACDPCYEVVMTRARELGLLDEGGDS